MLWPEVVERFLPPAVVADCGQDGLGGQSCGGQHFHGLSSSPVQQVPRCPHRGAHRGSASLQAKQVTEVTGCTKKHDSQLILVCHSGVPGVRATGRVFTTWNHPCISATGSSEMCIFLANEKAEVFLWSLHLYCYTEDSWGSVWY